MVNKRKEGKAEEEKEAINLDSASEHGRISSSMIR